MYQATDHRGQQKLNIQLTLVPKTPPLPYGQYGVIVADPPWQYDLRETDASHRGRTPYPNMTGEAIKALPIGAIALDNSYLFLWTTNNHLPLAIECVAEWGFQYKTLHTWGKVTKNLSKVRYGIGHYGRGATEHIIIATKGSPPSFTGLKICDMPTYFNAPTGRHSAKPIEFWHRVNRVKDALDLPGIELFARESRPGWDVWGAEI